MTGQPFVVSHAHSWSCRSICLEERRIMKVIVVGGVAGSASWAARLGRLDEKAEIQPMERKPYLSYATRVLMLNRLRAGNIAGGMSRRTMLSAGRENRT